GLHHPEKPGGAPSADQGAGRARDPDRAAPGSERDRLGQCREISRGGGSSGNRTFTRAPGSGTGIRRYDEKLIIVIVRAEPAHPHPLAQVALATSPASGRGNSPPRPADPAGRGKAEGRSAPRQGEGPRGTAGPPQGCPLVNPPPAVLLDRSEGARGGGMLASMLLKTPITQGQLTGVDSGGPAPVFAGGPRPAGAPPVRCPPPP